MAGLLQSVVMKSIHTVKNPDSVEKIKTIASHVGMFIGLIGYTAIGAKVGRNLCVLLIIALLL